MSALSLGVAKGVTAVAEGELDNGNDFIDGPATVTEFPTSSPVAVPAVLVPTDAPSKSPKAIPTASPTMFHIAVPATPTVSLTASPPVGKICGTVTNDDGNPLPGWCCHKLTE
jgi:hypothetical protein